MTARMIFLKDHEDYKIGDDVYIERQLAIKLCQEETVIPYQTNIDNINIAEQDKLQAIEDAKDAQANADMKAKVRAAKDAVEQAEAKVQAEADAKAAKDAKAKADKEAAELAVAKAREDAEIKAIAYAELEAKNKAQTEQDAIDLEAAEKLKAESPVKIEIDGETIGATKTEESKPEVVAPEKIEKKAYKKPVKRKTKTTKK